MHALHSPVTADLRDLLARTTTLAPRLLLGAPVQLPLPASRDPVLLRTRQVSTHPLQVPLTAVLLLHTSQHQLLVLTMLPRLELWMVLHLGHTVTIGHQAVP